MIHHLRALWQGLDMELQIVFWEYLLEEWHNVGVLVGWGESLALLAMTVGVSWLGWLAIEC